MTKRWDNFFLILAIVTLLLFKQVSIQAAEQKEFSPFFVNNVLPVSIGLGLPKALSANSLKQGQKQLVFNLGVKSNANDSGSAIGEMLRLDGETYSLDVGLAYGLTQRWQLDAQVSYLRHTAGSLDSLIDGWHDFFGLDDGDRPLFERDQFEYSYTNGDTSEVVTEDDGISDFRLGIGYAIKQSEPLNFLIRAGISLPTGDADNLTGSDDVDADIGLYFNGRGQQGRWKNVAWHANLGYLLIGDEQALGIPTESSAWFSSLGAYWTVFPSIVLKSQLDSHGAFFDSDIDELTRAANEITIGMSYLTKQGGQFEIYFSEDVSVNRAADFSFGISKKIKF